MKLLIDTYKAWIMLGVLALIWGSSFILMKKGLVVFSSVEVAALRIASAGLFMAPMAFSRLKGLSRKDWSWLIASGLTGSLIPAFLFTTAQTQLSSAITGVLNATTPLFVLIVGVIVFKQQVVWRQTFGLILGFLGSFLLTLSGNGGLGDVNLYALLVILATLCYGSNLNLIKFRLCGLKPVTITSLSLGVFTLPLLIYLLGFSDLLFHIQNTPGATIALSYILLLGIVGTAFALILFNKLVQLSSPIFTSSVTYLIPLVAMGWGFLDGEDLRLIHLFGMATILFGVYVTNRKKGKNPIPTAAVDAQKPALDS
jgi:drug/metabolite transporter (DMT)-like permease